MIIPAICDIDQTSQLVLLKFRTITSPMTEGNDILFPSMAFRPDGNRVGSVCLSSKTDGDRRFLLR